MYKVEFVDTIEQFLEHNQIITLLKDQMVYIGSPKTNEELIDTIKLVLQTEHSYLMVLSDLGHIIGFAFFNICIGMESAGKYLWLNEMHIHEGYRSRGFGAILYEEMLKWCKENDIVRIMGMADEKDLRTKAFYKKMGADIYRKDIINMKVCS